jgi:hypothetical protein
VKGFLPTSCYALWKDPDPKPRNYFYQYEWRFVVDESKLVNGLWMPTKLRDAICANGERAKGNLDMQTVQTVELGNAKESNLRLPFPEGTFVQDRLKGIVYRAGPNGEAMNPKTLYLTPPAPLLATPDQDQTAELRKGPNQRRWLYIALINVVAVSMLAFVFLKRGRERREARKTQDTGTDPALAPATGTNS